MYQEPYGKILKNICADAIEFRLYTLELLVDAASKDQLITDEEYRIMKAMIHRVKKAIEESSPA